jgi:hypothetical protein
VLLLHLYYILAEVVFPCDLIALREMIDFLILIKAFIDVGFAARVTPEDIPVVGFCVLETVGFEDRPD